MTMLMKSGITNLNAIIQKTKPRLDYLLRFDGCSKGNPGMAAAAELGHRVQRRGAAGYKCSISSARPPPPREDVPHMRGEGGAAGAP